MTANGCSTPVPLSRSHITGGFWHERQRINREVTIPIEYEQCKNTGRLEAWKLEWQPGDPNPPHHFWDSDTAKWIEAVAYSLVHSPDAALEAQLDEVIGWIEAAQQADGYLNIHYTVVRPEMRWKNLCQWHELYCAGHLIEAAVAHFEATGKRKLLDVLCRYADHIDATFGPADEGKRPGYPGHEELELALVKLYRATGNRRYLELSTFFVNQRGSRPHYFDQEAEALGNSGSATGYNYNQSHLPVREQTTAEGHSVRACYLYAGMADVARETGDQSLFDACRAIWDNLTQRRMYVHGGIGSSRFGERFTFDHDLPNEDAYAETCAAIALVFFARRMLDLEPDRRYSDIMELALFNGVISGVSLDGRRFFYDNLLAAHPEYHTFSGQKPPRRQEWFGCACCPPNLARLLAGLDSYVYSESENTAWIHLFTEGTAKLDLGGRKLGLQQCTQYPWDETVLITVAVEQATPFTLAVRVPAWCRCPVVKLNGTQVDLSSLLKNGYAMIEQTWSDGDEVTLVLPMPVERLEAHPSVRQDAGRVALQRGPVLYCLEQLDNGPDLADVRLPSGAELSIVRGCEALGGVPTVVGKGLRRDAAAWKDDLYRQTPSPLTPCDISAVPYYCWGNRGPGEMIVWVLQSGNPGESH